MTDVPPPPSDQPPERAEQQPSDPTAHPVFRQELLPQEIQPAPRRTGLYVVIAAVVVIVAAVCLTVFLLGRSDGGGDRDAYCNTLSDATNNGRLAGVLQQTDVSVIDQLADEAPDAVADDWDKLVTLRDRIEGGDEPSAGEALTFVTALQNIVTDADDNCGITIELPSP